jgi:hypothetical protein
MIEAARRRKYEQQRRGEGKERTDRSERERERDRDRDRRERGDKEKSSRPSRRMDIIDQLDATSIYGTGGMPLCFAHLRWLGLANID